MTKLLSQALKAVEILPPEEQDRIARMIIDATTRATLDGIDIEPEQKTPVPFRVTKADLDWLAANRVGNIMPKESAGELLSRMRDEEQR